MATGDAARAEGPGPHGAVTGEAARAEGAGPTQSCNQGPGPTPAPLPTSPEILGKSPFPVDRVATLFLSKRLPYARPWAVP